MGVLLAYFAARLFFLAWAVDGSIPPDETTHLGRVHAYASTWLLPENGPGSYALGLLSHRPFLYSWSMARLVELLALFERGVPVSDLLWLRLWNALLALGTVAYGLRFVRRITPDPVTVVLFLVMLTNTMMFTGVAAAVHYDNLTNLAAVASVYYLFRYREEREPAALGAFALSLAVGCLTKRSFLPLAALLVGVLLVSARAALPLLLRDVRRFAATRRLAAALVALGVTANGVLYVGNLVRYQHLVPAFDQVVGREAAMKNRIFARDAIVAGYREGRLDWDEAQRLARAIPHAGDRQSALFGLQRTRVNRGRRISPTRYVWLWGRIMLDRAFGYFGHQIIVRRGWELAGYAGVLALALALHVARALARAAPTPESRGNADARQRARRAGLAGLVALLYALVLLLLVHYPGYRETGLLDAGVQGRYLFPVWAPLLAFTAHAIAEEAPRRLRLPLAALVAAFFLYGDLPILLLRATPAWLGGSA